MSNLHPTFTAILAAHGVTPDTRLAEFNRARVRAFYEGEIRRDRDNAAHATTAMINLTAELADEPQALRQDDLRRRIAAHRARRDELLAHAELIEAQMETLVEEAIGA